MPSPLRFNQPLQVHVLRLPAELGVLFKYAESALLNLSDLDISNAAAAPVVARNSGLAAPGILVKRSAAK